MYVYIYIYRVNPEHKGEGGVLWYLDMHIHTYMNIYIYIGLTQSIKVRGVFSGIQTVSAPGYVTTLRVDYVFTYSCDAAT